MPTTPPLSPSGTRSPEPQPARRDRRRWRIRAVVTLVTVLAVALGQTSAQLTVDKPTAGGSARPTSPSSDDQSAKLVPSAPGWPLAPPELTRLPYVRTETPVPTSDAPAVTPDPTPAPPTPAPAAPNTPAPPPPIVTAGIWIGGAELARLPTSGRAWDSVVDAAADADTNGDVSDQDSTHDQATLAAALVTARTGQQRDRAVAALESAIGTEQDGDGRWLEVGRNMLGYIIAADLLGIRSGPVYDWLASFRTMRLAHNNSGQPITFRESAWSSGSNASAQEGAVYAALGVYLKDASMQRWSWDAFRRYAGDRSSPHRITSNSDIWQQTPADPVGIQNTGATRDGCSIDGAISNDMSRGSDDVCDPGYTQYPWVGMEGAVPAAMILSRAGYPAWDAGNRALRRAAVYMMGLTESTGDEEWYDAGRAPEIKHLLNRVYGLGYPASYPVGGGRTIGFTDYTHP